MKLGMVGLGKMGANMAERLLKGGHKVIGNARSRESVERAIERGIEGAYTLDEMVGKLEKPRIIWLMIPAGPPVDESIGQLMPLLDKGDILVDGGNSYYKDTIRRVETLKGKGINYIDVGTSGGIQGLTEGYSMMVGGEKASVDRIRPILETLAPSPDRGWGRVGPSGAGHFVKMVHNGIEYGLMQAYAEGFSLMKQKDEFKLDLHNIAEIWRFGSVVRSWLLDLISETLEENPEMKGIAPFVEDSGEGRWTVHEAIDMDVALPVITLSLFRRMTSRGKDDYADKLLASMRNKFGGHEVKKEV